MRKELEGARYSNSALLENNANLQVEIDSMNNHIRVVSHQNDELTREIDQFVQANEVIRQRLDRKNRVMEIRERNEYHLQQSMAKVHSVSKSPIRQWTFVHNSLLPSFNFSVCSITHSYFSKMVNDPNDLTTFI